MADPQPTHDRITPDQIEAKFRGLMSDVENRANEAKQTVMPIAIGAGLLVVLLAYLLGKRVGKKKSTVVEIRRI